MNELIQTYKPVQIDFYPQIPPLEKVKDKTKIDVRYCLIAPFAYVHIYWNEKKYELVYEIEEPILNIEEEGYKEKLSSAMRDLINIEQVIDKTKDALLDYIDRRFKLLAVEFDMDIPYDSYKKIFYYLCRDFMGINEIEPILKDYYVEDIECNGSNAPVYIIHRIYRNIRTNLSFNNVD